MYLELAGKQGLENDEINLEDVEDTNTQMQLSMIVNHTKRYLLSLTHDL